MPQSCSQASHRALSDGPLRLFPGGLAPRSRAAWGWAVGAWEGLWVAEQSPHRTGPFILQAVVLARAFACFCFGGVRGKRRMGGGVSLPQISPGVTAAREGAAPAAPVPLCREGCPRCGSLSRMREGHASASLIDNCFFNQG